MSNLKMPGIAWNDHTPRAGERYDLKHLHPFQCSHELPESDKHPARTVNILVVFGLHTFTRAVEHGDPVEDHYRDTRETRCFCRERYELSVDLPTIVREIPTKRPIFYSRTLSGTVSYATFDTGRGGIYAVFFDLRLYAKLGPNSVLMTVISAYQFSPNKRDTRVGRVGFNVILGHAIRGTKPKPPPRAR